MAWISFGALPCKENMMTARVSMLLKSRASPTCFRACFLPGRVKDLSSPRYNSSSSSSCTYFLERNLILKHKSYLRYSCQADKYHIFALSLYLQRPIHNKNWTQSAGRYAWHLSAYQTAHVGDAICYLWHTNRALEYYFDGLHASKA